MSAHNYLLDINNLLVSQPNKSSPTKLEAKQLALSAITIIASSLDTKLFGARDPPRMGDAIVKLFARRLRVDEVTLRWAKNLVAGHATKGKMNWFRSLVVCFDGMVERDVKRARRRISKEPILTDKAKELMKRMVWHSNFWERYMDLPARSTTKRRNNNLSELLFQAMEKVEKKEMREKEKVDKEKQTKAAKAAQEAHKTQKTEDAEYELTEEQAACWKAALTVDDGDGVEVLVVEANESAGGEAAQQEIGKAVDGNDDLESSVVEAKETEEVAAEKKRLLDGGKGGDEDDGQKVSKLAQSVVVDGTYRWV